MAGTQPALVVRVAATLDEFKKNLAEGVAQIEVTKTALTKMAASYDGSKIIQSANATAAAIQSVGGASNLTAAEQTKANAILEAALEKYRVLGKDAPAGMRELADATKQSVPFLSEMQRYLAGMFTVGAVIGFAKEVIDLGSHLQKMADQTGLSVDQVQKLSYVAGQTDVSVDALISGVQNLQQRLGDDTSGTAGAMAKLRINMVEFNKLDSYGKFTVLADAVRGLKDPTEQAATAADLFGKSWKEIIPAIKAGIDDLGEQAPRFSKAEVEALDAISDAYRRLKDTVLIDGGKVILAIGHVGDQLGTSAKQVEDLKRDLAPGDGLAGAMAAIPPIAGLMSTGYKDISLSAKDAESVIKDLNVTTAFSAEVNREAADSAKETAKEYEHMGDVVQKVMDEIVAAQKKATEDIAREVTAQQSRILDEIASLNTLANKLHGDLYGAPEQDFAGELQLKLEQAERNRGALGNEMTDQLERDLIEQESRRQQQAAAAGSKGATTSGGTGPSTGGQTGIGLGTQIFPSNVVRTGYLGGIATSPLPSFAEGGYGDFGAGTPAMLHGKEHIIPDSQMPGASITIASGAIVIQYPIMNDAIALARVTDLLAAGLMKRLTSTGYRPSSGA